VAAAQKRPGAVFPGDFEDGKRQTLGVSISLCPLPPPSFFVPDFSLELVYSE
jgi:hypothetical protein